MSLGGGGGVAMGQIVRRGFDNAIRQDGTLSAQGTYDDQSIREFAQAVQSLR